MAPLVRGRIVEIDDVATLVALLGSGARALRGWRLRDLDLTPYEAALRAVDVRGSVFLGCRLSAAGAVDLRERGALVFPEIDTLPFDPYRGTLYTADELYDGLAGGYASTRDAIVYAWSRRDRRSRVDAASLTAEALHDQAIDSALDTFAEARRIAGVMGGHDVRRDSPAYAEAARLGHGLAARGLTVATGGGPGAMEAANLGATASATDQATLAGLVAALAEVPEVAPSRTAWARSGLAVRDRIAAPAESLAVPTWFYGHEPPHVFASHIAKFFANATREDTLLRRCNAGIVFLPGAAGTVAEVFADACENYYADPTLRAPMVLLGRRFWTEEVPAWPLLRALAGRAGFADSLVLADHLDEAFDIIVG